VRLDLSRVRDDTVRIRLESAPSFWLIDYAAIDYSEQKPFQQHEVPVSSIAEVGDGDVRNRLATVDREYVVLETGDSYELEYIVPNVHAGMQRSYRLASNGWYRIHTGDAGPAQIALLKQVETQPYAISKIAVARLNEAIRRLEESAR